MALHVVQTIDLKLLRDSAGERRVNDDPDTIDTTTGLFTSTFPQPDEGTVTDIEVADSATATIPLTNIDEVNILFISTDRQLTLTYTDAVEGAGQKATIGSAAARIGRYLLNGGVTAATLTNNSGATAKATVVIAGT